MRLSHPIVSLLARRRPPLRPSALLLPALLLIGALATACGGDDSSGSGGTGYAVTATDTSCQGEEATIASGTTTFEVDNQGSDVTEVYVYGKEGDSFSKIMGEAENIGPGTAKDFTVDLPSGAYEIACKPGMTGDGIRVQLTVTGDTGGGGY